MEYGDFRPKADHFITLLKEISRNTNNNACCVASTFSGVNTSVPANLNSVAIVLTSGTAEITLSDGSIYPLTVIGEVFSDSAPFGKALPMYTISGSGTWKWHGIS